MFIFLLIFAAVCLWQVQLKPAGNDRYITDYMSVDKTMAIKGIFIIVVFFSHFNTYVDFTSGADLLYLDCYSKIGQRMVTLFMFYSGFGVMEAIKKKKMTYVHKIPVTRVLGTYFRFDIAIILFLLLKIIINGGALGTTPNRVFLALFGWESIGNSNWYIFAIVVCYILTFVAFEVFRDKLKYYPSAILLTLLLFAYVVIMRYCDLHPDRFYNTVLCYALGVYFSLLKDKFDKLFGNNKLLWLAAFLVTSVLTVIAQFKIDRFYAYEIAMFSFTFAVILFTMRVSLNNKILRWCGKHLFSIYILQRIPMIAFDRLGIAKWNIYVYFILCLGATVIMAYFFEKYVGALWKYITSPRETKAIKE